MRQLQETFASNVAKLIQFIFAQGYTCTLGEAYRTQEQANWYAEKGTGSKNSLHCKRLAIDLNIFKDGVLLSKSDDYEFAGEYWYSIHNDNRWGGAGGDGNHFSMTDTGKGW
jgi:hypothetical protein